jgi:hypothetical protein
VGIKIIAKAAGVGITIIAKAPINATRSCRCIFLVRKKEKKEETAMVIANERSIRTRKSGTVLVAALALVMMITPARTFVAPVLLPTSVLSQHLCTQRRANQLQDTARNLHALATSGGIKVGDRVEILVKTVSFSKKLMANNLSSRDLTGVVKFVTCPEEQTELAMATIEFHKVACVCVCVCVCVCARARVS